MREGAGESPGQRGSFLLRHGTADQATFVELFSGLAMVFILSRLVAQAFDVLIQAEPEQALIALGHTLLLFLPLMRVWTLTTYITARFDPRRPVVQVAVIGSVFGVLVFGTSVHSAFGGRALAFALTYIVLSNTWSTPASRPPARPASWRCSCSRHP